MRNKRLLFSAGYCLPAALLAIAATGALAWDNPLEHPYTNGPLDICDQGTFHVGGVPKITPYADSNEIGVPQQNIIGQMYVQFQIPKKRRQWPVIMVHGGGYSGSCLSSTPQATEGWDSYAIVTISLLSSSIRPDEAAPPSTFQFLSKQVRPTTRA